MKTRKTVSAKSIVSVWSLDSMILRRARILFQGTILFLIFVSVHRVRLDLMAAFPIPVIPGAQNAPLAPTKHRLGAPRAIRVTKIRQRLPEALTLAHVNVSWDMSFSLLHAIATQAILSCPLVIVLENTAVRVPWATTKISQETVLALLVLQEKSQTRLELLIALHVPRVQRQ